MSKVMVSVEGFVASELEVRQAGSHRVVDVSVAHTPRKQVNGSWEDAGDTEWFRASFWDDDADAVLDSVQKGSLVTVTGSLKSRPYTRKDGSLSAGLEITFPVLSVVVRKRTAVPAVEPWAASTTAVDNTQWGGGSDASTPF